MRSRQLAVFLGVLAGAQLCLYLAWMLGKDWLFYFNPRIGLDVFLGELTGYEPVGPSFLSWLSLLWLGLAAIAVARWPKSVRVYQVSELLFALPSFAFFVMVIIANLGPTHGFSISELPIPVGVFCVFSVLPLVLSYRNTRGRRLTSQVTKERQPLFVSGAWLGAMFLGVFLIFLGAKKLHDAALVRILLMPGEVLVGPYGLSQVNFVTLLSMVFWTFVSWGILWLIQYWRRNPKP